MRSTAPVWESEATLSAAPRLELVSDDPETVLYQVVDVAVLSDDHVAVANRGDASVRLYDATGNLVWKAGREGDGPGEFRDLRGLEVLGEALWAYQSLPRPVHVFDLGGHLVGSVPTPGLIGPWFRGVLSGGSVVAIGRANGSSSDPVFVRSAPVVRFDRGSVDTLAVLPFRSLVNTSLGPEQQALGPTLSVAAAPGRVYAGFSASWDIMVFDSSGRLTRRIRRAWRPVPITEAHEAAYVESLMEQAAGRPRFEEAFRQLAQDMVYPGAHPAFSRLLVGRSGTLWVERPQTEPPWSQAIDYNPVRPDRSEWDLFREDGSWLGTVEVPARFRVMDVGTDYVAGVAKDELDVETVQVWRLTQPE